MIKSFFSLKIKSPSAKAKGLEIFMALQMDI